MKLKGTEFFSLFAVGQAIMSGMDNEKTAFPDEKNMVTGSLSEGESMGRKTNKRKPSPSS